MKYTTTLFFIIYILWSKLKIQYLFFQNLYINPQNSAKSADGSHLTNVSDEEMQEHYDNFFEDVFVEAEDK